MTAEKKLPCQKQVLILFLTCIIALNSFCQKKIFYDDFNNNKNSWAEYKGEHSSVQIINGVLHFEKFNKNFTDRGCVWYNKTIPRLNTAEDFSITYYAKYISGGDIFDAMDFQWGNTDNRSLQGNIIGGFYQLQFDLIGRVDLNYFESKWTYFVRKDIRQILSPDFNPRVFNKYDIIQKDSFLIVKVNDKEILRQFYTPVAGHGIGVQQCLKSAWEMDKITIRQAGKKRKMIFAPVVPFVNKNDIAVSSPLDLKVSPNPFDKKFQVNFYLEKEENVQLSLVDMNGITLQQHHKYFPRGNNSMDIYADVPAGTYILKLQMSSKSLSAKLVKQ